MIDKDTHYIEKTIDKDGQIWWILVDANGNQISDYVYRHIFGGSEEGFYEVYRNNKHGHIDLQGKERIPCMYDNGLYFSEGIVSECLNGKWGCIDAHNNTIIPFEYEDLGICSNNTICAKLNGKWGLINKFNEILIDFIYDELDNFAIREVIAHPAKLDGKWGLINKLNDTIEDFIYDEIEWCSDEEGFEGKFLKITKNNKIALYLATENKFLTDFIFDGMEYLSEGRFRIRQNCKFGYINTLGETIVEPIYERADYYYKDEKVVVQKDGMRFALDLYGNKIPYCQKKPKLFISSKFLEHYPIKDKIIGKVLEKIYVTGNIYNEENLQTNLVLDEPIILNFGNLNLEIEYSTGSYARFGLNCIDTTTDNVKDVSKFFAKNIIGHKVIDFVINKTDRVYFMNFSHLNIKRKNGDDMFDEIYLVFDNGYKLEICSDHCDYMLVNEIKGD